MKKKIEDYLPRAIDIVKEVGIANPRNEVDNRFSGYFSAFGASIIMSGMKPTLAFYSNDKTVGDRSKILSAVYRIIRENNAANEPVEPKDLLTYYIENETDNMLKQKILDATIALKLAVRTYTLIKKD